MDRNERHGEQQATTGQGDAATSTYTTSAGIVFGAADEAVDAGPRDARPAAAQAADDDA